MNPLQMLLMAARGHQGLPPQIQHAPQPQPPAPGGGGGAPADRQVAQQASSQLMQAVGAAKDPQLKVALSSALAALHKYLAQDQKEQHQALQGKLSPRLMAQSVGR